VQRYSSAVYAMALRMSIRHKSEFYQNGLRFWAQLILCYKWIRVLPSGTLSQSQTLADYLLFCHSMLST